MRLEINPSDVLMHMVMITVRLHRSFCILACTICCLCLLLSPAADSAAQVAIRNGAKVSVKQDAVVVIKSLVHNSGYLRNEGTIVIENYFINNDTTEGIGTDTFMISGDWINNKTFMAGQSTVILTGDSQTIRGTVPTAFYNLALSGTGMKSMDTAVTVSNHLALNDSEFSTGKHKLAVTATDANAISRTTGFVSSRRGGTLERFMDDTLEYIFPLGSSEGTARYRPVAIVPADTGSIAVAARFANHDATLELYNLSNRSPDICHINSLFYHQIQRTAGVLPVSITMFYKPADDGGIWTQIAHWQNVPRWEWGGPASQGADTAFRTVTLAGVSSFSYAPFALMTPNPLLDSAQTVITDVSCNSGNDGSICVSNPPLTGTPPFQYLWSNGAATSCITGLAAGNYTLTLVDSSGCSSQYSFTVGQPNNINVSATVTDVSCKGGADGSICISVTGDFPPFSFSWLTGPGDSCLTGFGAGSYSTTVTDFTGCSIVLVNRVDEPALLVATAQSVDVTCFGFDDGVGSATVFGGVQPYDYAWNSPAHDTTGQVSGLPPGDYRVTVTDYNGCTADAGITISEPQPLYVIAGRDTTIFKGFTAWVEAVSTGGGIGRVTYQWSPATTVAQPASPATLVTPGQTTVYVIAVTDENGCVATDSVRVQVDVNYNTFPDAFIPNGVNNIFPPPSSLSATVQVLRLEIYNRWGQLLSSDPTGWDGKYKGKLQPMDTYVYQAILQLPDGTRKKQRGDFILIR